MDEEIIINNARAKLRKIKGLIKHAIIFLIVNFIFGVVNFYLYPERLWFLLVFGVWSLFLISHYFFVYDFDELFFGRKWERKRLEKLVEKEQRKYFD